MYFETREDLEPGLAFFCIYDRHMIDVVIDRWDEFAKKLKDGKAPVSTIWFSER